jgi:hypothetical protein
MPVLSNTTNRRSKLPLPPALTIALDDAGHIHGLIGQWGRLLLERGADTFHVIDVMTAARAAARISEADALAVLETAGFRFIKLQGC